MNLEKIIKVTQSQYDILASGGRVGDYIGLDDNYIYLIEQEEEYQVKLVSGENIKTVNNKNILGSGNIPFFGDMQSIPLAGQTSVPNLSSGKFYYFQFDYDGTHGATSFGLIYLSQSQGSNPKSITSLGRVYLYNMESFESELRLQYKNIDGSWVWTANVVKLSNNTGASGTLFFCQVG